MYNKINTKVILSNIIYNNAILYTISKIDERNIVTIVCGNIYIN